MAQPLDPWAELEDEDGWIVLGPGGAQKPDISPAGSKPAQAAIPISDQTDPWAGMEDEDGWITIDPTQGQQTPEQEENNALLTLLGNIGLATGTGITTGVQTAGALLELVPGLAEQGKAIRDSGSNWTEYLTSNMSTEWQEAVNKSFLDLSSGSALWDMRSWAAGILQTIPYMIGTGGTGELAALGLRAVGVGAKAAARKGLVGEAAKQAASASARKLAYPGVAGAAGAGESAAGAAQDAEERGLSEEDRLTAMRSAALVGAPTAAVAGRFIEGIFGAKSVGKAFVAGTAGEAVEEAGTQAGTETGKYATGGEFSVRNILEAGTAGGLLGGLAGGGVNLMTRAANLQPKQGGMNNAAEEQALATKEAQIQRDIQPNAQSPNAPEATELEPVVDANQDRETQDQIQQQIGRRNVAIAKLEEKQKDNTRKFTKSDQTRLNKLKQERDSYALKLQGDQQPPDPAATPNANLDAQNAPLPMPPGEINKLPASPSPISQVVAQSGAPAVEPTQTEVPPPNNVSLTDQEIQRADQVAEQFDEAKEPEEPIETTNRVQRGQAATASVSTRKKIQRSPGGPSLADPRISPPPAPTAPSGNAEAQAIAATLSKPVTKTTAKQVSGVAPGMLTAEPSTAPGGSASAAPTARSAGTAQGPGSVLPPPELGPAGPIDPRTPRTRKQKNVEPAPTTLAVEEYSAQKLSENEPPTQDPGGQNVSDKNLSLALPTTKPKRSKPRAKMTPRERLARVLSQGPQDVDKVLAAVQDALNNKKDNITARLVEKLRKSFPNSKANPLKLTVENRSLSNGFQGLYDPKVDKIYIDMNQAEDVITALLHEVVHASVINRLGRDPEEHRRFAKYARDALDAWIGSGLNPNDPLTSSFNSAEEFVATALTNPQMADILSLLPVPNSAVRNNNNWKRFKERTKDFFGLRGDQQVSNYYDLLLEFIPDGSFIQDGNRQEWLAKLDELGVSNPSALFTSVMRSALRNNTVASMLPNQGTNRVRQWLLNIMTVEQIARSYGWIGESYTLNGVTTQLSNSVNNHYRLISEKDGYATKLKAQASRVMEVYRNAVSSVAGADKYLGDMLVDARMWSLHPDKPITDAMNIYGAALPGGTDRYNDLVARWKNKPRMTNSMKDAFNLVRSNATAERNEFINQLMITRMRGLAGAQYADQFEAMIYDPAKKITSPAASGVVVEYYPLASSAEISNFANTLPRPQAKRIEIANKVNEVKAALGNEQGPYVPLRRFGDYYTVLETQQRTVRMQQAAVDAFMRQNGDHDFVFVKKRDIPNTTLTDITYYHKYVSSHDTERQSNNELSHKLTEWSGWGLTPSRKGSYLARTNALDIVGVQSPQVNALMDELKRSIPGPAGEVAAYEVFKYYLEKLPDTSTRKSQLQAKKIPGASRDMLHVLSNHAIGASYTAAQLKYGHRINRVLGTDMDNDIKKLNENGFNKQANDLRAIQNHLRALDNKIKELSSGDYFGRNKIENMWNSLPQVAGAWVLTGPGTAITNAMQPLIMSYPHLAAIHNPLSAMTKLAGAMKDIVGPAGLETWREYKRFVSGGIRTAVKRSTKFPTFRDPQTTFFQKITARLPANEKALINTLADNKKIDFGLTADIQELAQRPGASREVLSYVRDGAFILPQAVETVNRTVTALASYRLNKDRVMADPRFATPELKAAELARIAAEDIDRTQWNYSAVNKPLIFQNRLLRPFLTFRTYSQALIYTIMKNMLDSFRGGSPRERAIARKTIAGITLGTLTMSGMMGIFMFDPIYIAMVALTSLFGDEGQDPEQLLRQAMQDFVGQDLADYLLKGVPYGAGVADTSRMGIPQFFPWQDIMKVVTDPNSKPDDFVGMVGNMVLGAPGSIAEQTWTGVRMLLEGNYGAGLSQALPKAFGANDAARAINYANNGIMDSRNYEAIPAEDISLAEKVVRALGFEPPEISRFRENNRSYYAREQAIRASKSGLLEEYANVFRERRYEDMDSVVDKIVAFNRKYPYDAITGQKLRQSIRQRARAEANVKYFGVNARTKGQQALAMDIAMGNPTEF